MEIGPLVLQPAMGWVLDFQWEGLSENGIRIYDLNAYHVAFGVMIGLSLLVYFYFGLAAGCWATSFLRIRRHAYALNATAAISTLLIIFIPFGTANYVYWLAHIRKKDMLPAKAPQSFMDERI
jgi:hypothetical protein